MFSNKVLSVGEWIGIYILLFIPLVNFVFVIVVLVSPATNPNLKNAMWAYIVLSVIGLVFYIILMLAIFSAAA
ncbi:MAG: hypothetical protein QM489_01830 [Candidatus Izemoplasma sp.]